MKRELSILQSSLIKVNQEYFSFKELPLIRLSKGQDKLKRKAIIFGTYHAKKNEIKIHPILLSTSVPLFVLEFIIYHELLHYEDREFLLNRKKGQTVHTSDFRRREQKFAVYDKAQKILKDILYGRINMEKETSIKVNKKISPRQRLTGEALENALSNALNNLDLVLSKYNLLEKKVKGVKSGSKKIHDENQLDCNA